jgi:hypothetical protein
MDITYVFLCGVMWFRYGQEEAAWELLRATKSLDQDIQALARAMLIKGIKYSPMPGCLPSNAREGSAEVVGYSNGQQMQ